MKKTKVVIVSGGFDPLHSGHITYLDAAKNLGDVLIVGINSDDWLIRKKGNFFLPFKERKMIVHFLKPVTLATDFDDSDGSACKLIEKVIDGCDTEQEILKKTNPNLPDVKDRYHFIFANGGDRTKFNIPEMNWLYKYPIEFAFGVGGEEKLNSSSEILNRWYSK